MDLMLTILIILVVAFVITISIHGIPSLLTYIEDRKDSNLKSKIISHTPKFNVGDKLVRKFKDDYLLNPYDDSERDIIEVKQNSSGVWFYKYLDNNTYDDQPHEDSHNCWSIDANYIKL